MSLRNQMHSQKTAWAKQLRKKPAYKEAEVWKLVRGKRFGVRFRRQVPLLGYIADFYCPTAKLVVEIDGSSHEGRENYDNQRDSHLARKGIRTLRVASNASVETIERLIWGEINGRR